MLPTEDLVALARRAGASFVGRCVHRFIAMAGIDRSLVLASQAFTALIPLLILASTLAPSGMEDVVSRAIIDKFGLTGDSADAVAMLFDIPPDASSSLSVASAVLLVFSGVSFTRRLQRMYRAAWDLEKTGIRGGLFAALGLVALLAEVLLLYAVSALVQVLPFDWLLAIPVSAATGLVLWTSIPYLLLNRQVHWRRLLGAGAMAALGTAVYGAATSIYMPALVERYTSEFGLFGVTIALLGWLLAIAGVLVAATAIGAEFDQSRAEWALDLKARYHLEDPNIERPASTAGTEAEGLRTEDLLLLGRVLVSWLVMAGAVWIATLTVDTIDVSGGFWTYLWVSLLLGLVNAVLGPLLRLVALPMTIPTLGLFALFVNGFLLAVTAGLSKDLDVGGFGGTVLGAVIISVVITLVEFLVLPLQQDE